MLTRLAVPIAALALLAGCAGGIKLSDIAQAACATQAAANVATSIAERHGNLTLAAHFAEASRGFACSW